MATKNNIPTGYKDSAVGIIPQEWEVATLGKLGKVISGLTYSPDDISDTGILVLRSSNIHNGMLCMADNVYVNTVSYNPVKTGDILICVRNGSKNLIGKSAYITPHYEGAAFGAFMSIYRSANNNYLKHLFNSDIFYKNVHRNLGATINSINGNDLKKFVIPVPPLAEQRKIAEILGVWDEAIEKQSRLIEKLELRKRALMQRLLTGRTRLPGFTAPWQKCLYSDILKEVKRTMTWDDNEEYDLISVKRRSGGLFHRDRLLGKDIKTKNLRPAKCGDFLISKMQIVHGASGLVTEEFDEMKISGSYIALVAINGDMVDMKFINWYSKTPYFYHQTYVSSYGVHIEKMTFDLESFMSMNIMLPPFPEQKAIVAVLTTADDEIATHRKKLDALRLQKRGLMQQLLTGKTRVKI